MRCGRGQQSVGYSPAVNAELQSKLILQLALNFHSNRLLTFARLVVVNKAFKQDPPATVQHWYITTMQCGYRTCA